MLWFVLPPAEAQSAFVRNVLWTDDSADHEPVQVSMAFDDDAKNEHYFAFTRAETTPGLGYDHELLLTWPGLAAPTVVSTRMADRDYALGYYYASLVAPPRSAYVNVFAIRAGNTGGSTCAVDEPVLEEIRVHREIGTQRGVPKDVDTVLGCVKHHRSFALFHEAGPESTFEVCWTVETKGQDDVYCDDRPWPADAWQDSTDPDVTVLSADPSRVEDHAWPVAEDDGTLRAAFHYRDATLGHTIGTFRESGAGVTAISSGGFRNFPTMARVGDTYHVAWQDSLTNEVHYARCATDCEDPALWTVPVLLSPAGHDADGPQLVAKDDHVLVFYDDADPGGPKQVRVSFSSDGGVTWCDQLVDASQGQREEMGKGPYAAIPSVAVHEVPGSGTLEVDVAYVQDDAGFGAGGATDSTTHLVYASANLADLTCGGP